MYYRIYYIYTYIHTYITIHIHMPRAHMGLWRLPFDASMTLRISDNNGSLCCKVWHFSSESYQLLGNYTERKAIGYPHCGSQRLQKDLQTPEEATQTSYTTRGAGRRGHFHRNSYCLCLPLDPAHSWTILRTCRNCKASKFFNFFTTILKAHTRCPIIFKFSTIFLTHAHSKSSTSYSNHFSTFFILLGGVARSIVITSYNSHFIIIITI